MSFYGSYPPGGGGGGGTGNILSINGDTTAAQVITGGTGISAATVSGTTTITATAQYVPTIDSATLGSNKDISTLGTGYTIFTSPSLSSIASIVNTGVSAGQTFIITNRTGANITLINNYGSAPGTSAIILTGAGANLVIPANQSVQFVYKTSGTTSWVPIGINGIIQLANASMVSGVLPIANGGTNSSAGTPTFTNVSTGIVKNTATQTTLSGSVSGSAVFSQPEQGSSYKKVVIFLSSWDDDGSTVYTFPTAFTNTPYKYVQTISAGAVTVTTTTVAITTASGSGFVFLEGY